MPSALPRASILALCLPLLACGGKPQPAPAPAPPPAAAPASAPAPVVEPPPPAAAPIPETEVKAALDAWLSAQNQGDFEGYAQLYAAKLYGVKRAGERVTRFDRAGWLADRRRMFQKPMQVEAREPQIRSSSAGAQVELTQHWASGKFEDLGQKRLLFVREAGQLKIAQEEMLSSQLLAAADAADWSKRFHFVITLASGAYLALPEERPPAQEGAPRREQDPGDKNLYVTSRATRAGALPAWSNARLRLDTGCVATIAEVRVLSRVVPHFGIVDAWLKGTEDPPHPPLTPAQLAQQAFVSGTPLTAVRLEGCAQGKYAVLESLPQPVAAEPVSDAGLTARARSAFAALPGVKEQQRTYLKEVAGAKGQWWEPGLRIAIGRHPQSGQTLISAQAQNGGPCEELGAGTWALFELNGAQLRLLRESDAGSAVEQLLDVNGDGKLEVLTHGELGTERELIVPQQESPAAQLVYDYQDCPC